MDEVAVGVDLQMSVGFEFLGLPDISMKEESEIEGHLNGVKKLLHSLPENTTLQFVIQANEGDPSGVADFLSTVKSNPSLGELGMTILNAKEKFLKNKFIQKRRTFLFVTTSPSDHAELPLGGIPKVPWASVKHKDQNTITLEMHRVRHQHIRDLAKNVVDSLVGMGVTVKRLGRQELGEYFYRGLNPTRTKTCPLPPPFFKTDRPVTTRSLLALSAAQEEFGMFMLDGVYHKAINLLCLPESIQPVDLINMTNELWPDYDLCLSVHCINSEKMIEKLKTSTNVAQALSFSNFGSRYEAEQKFSELDELIREIRATPQKLFTFSFCLLIKGKNREEVEAKASMELKPFQELGSAVGLIDDMNHEDLFLSFFPNHTLLNDRKHVIHTNPLASLLPLSTSWKGTLRPKILFENPQGELVNMDLFDPSLPSKHALLVGSTGSGKSFTTNYLLTNFLVESEDNHVVIIDIGGSYRKLCQLFDGKYLSVDLSEEYAFNPFPERNAIFDGKGLDEDAITYLTLILERMILENGEFLESAGETLLGKSIKRAYELTMSPTLKDVRQALSDYRGYPEMEQLARRFSNNLEMWSDDRYAKIFNSSTHLDFKNRLMVFDLEHLSQHPRLQSVYFYVIREIIDSKLRNKKLKKIIVIDEGWRFFNDDVGSRLIENLYRTARKSNGMILSISQSPVDFLNTKAANAIISNTYVKYVLRLTKGHELLPQFNFTVPEIEAVKNLQSAPRQFSDVFLKFNDKATTLRIEPSPLDYWICTTDAEDTLKEEQLRHAHPEWSHARVISELTSQFKRESV